MTSILYRSAFASICFYILFFLPVRAAAEVSPIVSSLSDALAKTIDKNPELRGYEQILGSSKAMIEQAALYPNPQFGVEVEDFGGQLDGFEQSETTVSIDQPILLGGKRSSRINLAEANRRIVEIEKEIRVLNIANELKYAYAEVVQAKAVVGILEEQLRLSRTVVSSVSERVAAGATLVLEQTKARIRLDRTKIELQNARNSLEIAKQNLVSYWGGSVEELHLDDRPLAIGDTEKYLASNSLEGTPLYRLARASINSSQRQYEVAQSKRVPDVAVGIGFRRLEQVGANALMARFSMDLPVFNRNQGEIKSVNKQLEVTRYELASVKIRLERELRSLRLTLRGALKEHQMIRSSLFPSAKKAFAQAKEAYRVGRSSYLDLLDSQRTLVETKRREQVVVLLAIQAKTRIATLIGALDEEF